MTFRDHATAVTVAALLTIAVLMIIYGHVLLLGPYLSTCASAFLVATALRQRKDDLRDALEAARVGKDHAVLAALRLLRSFVPLVPASLTARVATKRTLSAAIVCGLAVLAARSLAALIAGLLITVLVAVLFVAEPYLWSGLTWALDGGCTLRRSRFLNNLSSVTLLVTVISCAALSFFGFLLLMWVEVYTTSATAVEWAEDVVILADPQIEAVRLRTQDLYVFIEERINATSWSPLFWEASVEMRRIIAEQHHNGAPITPALLYRDAVACVSVIVNALHVAGVEIRSVISNPSSLITQVFGFTAGTVSYLLTALQFTTGFFGVIADYLFRAVLFISIVHYFLVHPMTPIETILQPVPRKYRSRLASQLQDTIEDTFTNPLISAFAHGAGGLLICVLVGAPLRFLACLVASVLAAFPIISPATGLVPWSVALLVSGRYYAALLLVILSRAVFGHASSLRLSVHETESRSTIWLFGLMAFGPSGIILAPLLLRSVKVVMDEVRSTEAAAVQDSPALRPHATPVVVPLKEELGPRNQPTGNHRPGQGQG